MLHKSSSASTRILVSFAESLSAPEVLWSLLDAGFSVSAITREGTRPSLKSCKKVEIIEVTSPESDVQQTVDDLRQCLNTGRFAAILPLDDVSVWLCSRVYQDTGFTVIGPIGNCAELALNKNKQVEAALEAGIPVPRTRLVYTAEEIRSLDAFPLILKPAMSVTLRSGKLQKGRFYICDNPDELRESIKLWNGEPLLVQPMLLGTGEGIFGLATKDGVREWSAHRRIRMMNPAGSGASACTGIAVDEVLCDAVEAMLLKVGWQGIFMIEFLRDKSGKAWFMELNGRSWGSMALARSMGFEYPAWAVQQVLNEEFILPEVAARPPVLCRHLGYEILHMLIVLRGPKSNALTEWPSRWKTLCELLHLRRTDRWYNWRRGEARLFIHEAYRTITEAIARWGKSL